MNEGVYRVLRALGSGKRVSRYDLTANSGEPPSVLRDLLERKPKWFDVDDDGVLFTHKGLVALAMEMLARDSGQSLDEAKLAVLETLRAEARGRGRIKRELDQVWATLETTLARAELLIASGEVQRGLCFLGDDDLTSLAIHLMGVERRTTVIDVDAELISFFEAQAQKGGWEHQGLMHDLREPVPTKLRGRFGCVFTDPPYAPAGFALFISRAIDLLKPDGRLYVCFGSSRRSSERGLEKQRILADAGILLEEVLPDFNTYEGAESIGSRSTLWVGSITPQSASLVPESPEGPDGELYTRRAPKRGRS